jgi:hypothetical protein
MALSRAVAACRLLLSFFLEKEKDVRAHAGGRMITEMEVKHDL